MVLSRFSALHSYHVEQKEFAAKEPDIPQAILLPEDLKTITLADIEPTTKHYLSAHRLSDYRRKDSSILLVPDIAVTLDSFLFSREEVLLCPPTL